MYNGTVLLGDYLNFKAPMLDAFDRLMDVQHQLWRPGMSLLDVGGSLGLQAAYLAAAHGVKATVYEVPFTKDCPKTSCSRPSASISSGARHPSRAVRTTLSRS